MAFAEITTEFDLMRPILNFLCGRKLISCHMETNSHFKPGKKNFYFELPPPIVQIHYVL